MKNKFLKRLCHTFGLQIMFRLFVAFFIVHDPFLKPPGRVKARIPTAKKHSKTMLK